jgi:hypothetical protein
LGNSLRISLNDGGVSFSVRTIVVVISDAASIGVMEGNNGVLVVVVSFVDSGGRMVSSSVMI